MGFGLRLSPLGVSIVFELLSLLFRISLQLPLASLVRLPR